MAVTLPSGIELYRALLAEGFELPKECGDINLLMPVDGIFQLQLNYIVNVSGDDLAKLGRALARIGEAHRGQIAASVR
ncbi:MAG TPA: hypothetical protein VJ837_05350 [Candidatus Paceibacterota bacterium]|nr:hypothetical protein [Candidatus Paceibacterota bacterium]